MLKWSIFHAALAWRNWPGDLTLSRMIWSKIWTCKTTTTATYFEVGGSFSLNSCSWPRTENYSRTLPPIWLCIAEESWTARASRCRRPGKPARETELERPCPLCRRKGCQQTTLRNHMTRLLTLWTVTSRLGLVKLPRSHQWNTTEKFTGKTKPQVMPQTTDSRALAREVRSAQNAHVRHYAVHTSCTFGERQIWMTCRSSDPLCVLFQF